MTIYILNGQGDETGALVLVLWWTELLESVLSENGLLFTVGPMQKIYENEEFVCIHRFSRIANKDVFYEVLTAITYENRKVITQQMVRQELDYDPSEGQEWKWEDYE